MINAVRHAPPSGRSEQADFVITVLFTSAADTLSALHTAETLAADLGARVNLVNVQVVPYPLPLDRPPVYVEFLADQLRAVAEQSALRVEVHLYFGRDAADTLRSVLPAESILITGSRRQARRLRRCGHQIVVADGRHPRPRSSRAVLHALEPLTHL